MGNYVYRVSIFINRRFTVEKGKRKVVPSRVYVQEIRGGIRGFYKWNSTVVQGHFSMGIRGVFNVNTVLRSTEYGRISPTHINTVRFSNCWYGTNALTHWELWAGAKQGCHLDDPWETNPDKMYMTVCCCLVRCKLLLTAYYLLLGGLTWLTLTFNVR